MDKSETWSEFLFWSLRFYPALLISLFGLYKAWQEWLKNQLAIAKENSIGYTAMVELRKEHADIIKQVLEAAIERGDIKRDLARIEGLFEKLRQGIEDDWRDRYKMAIEGRNKNL